MPVVPLGGFQASVTLDVACACACDNNPTKSNPSTPNAIVRGTRATKLCQAIEGTRITRNIIESCILGDSSAGLLMPFDELEVKVRRPFSRKENFTLPPMHCVSSRMGCALRHRATKERQRMPQTLKRSEAFNVSEASRFAYSHEGNEDLRSRIRRPCHGR